MFRLYRTPVAGWHRCDAAAGLHGNGSPSRARPHGVVRGLPQAKG